MAAALQLVRVAMDARRGASLLSMAKAAAEEVVEKPGFVDRLTTAFLERFYRLIGGRQKVWPPSRESAPLQVVGWLSLIVILVLGVRQKVQPKILVVEQRRREYALGSLANLLKNENERVQDKVVSDAKEAKKKARRDAKEARIQSELAQIQAMQARGVSFPSSMMPDLLAKAEESSDEEGEENDELEEKDEDDMTEEEKAARDLKAADSGKKEEKIPPPSLKLFELLFDEIEHSPITSIGVSKDDLRYNEAMFLLAQRLQDELREHIDKTRLARQLHAGVALDPSVNVPKDTPQFMDGDKMVKFARFARDRVRRGMKYQHPAFQRDTIRKVDALIKEALVYSKQIGAESRRAARQIWLLIKPYVKFLVPGTLLLMCTEVSWGFWYGQVMALPNIGLNTAGNPAAAMAEASRMCLLCFVWFLFNKPADDLGDTLIDNSQVYFTLALRDQVMRSILRQDREYFDLHQAGVLQERLNRDTGMLSQTLIQQPKRFMSLITRLLAKFGYMYVKSKSLFYKAVLIPVPITCILAWAGVELVRKLNRKIHKVNETAAAGTIDVLKEMTTVRQFAMEQQEHEKYSVTNLFRRTLQRNLDTGRIFTWGLIGVGFWGTQIYVTYEGMKLVIQGLLSPTELLIIGINLHDLIGAIRALIDLVPQMIEMMEPIERVAATLDAVPRIEPHPDLPPKKPKLKPAHFRGHLVFNDVTFTYPTEMQKPVLKGFSFEVKPGQKVACVGKAGCGKSTSIGLLQRLYVPISGTITVDGEPIEDYDVHYLRRNIGVVAQDNILFSTSIKENIIYGMGEGHLPKPSDEEIWAILDKANAREFVETFPNLLNTNVGEKGVKLSGGQKQRIAIARAMIRAPSILFLDEATSALDPVNEKIVQGALDDLLKEHNGVSIVIAHRLTTVRNCDNIVVMDNGVKVEEGTHEELLKMQVIKTKDGVIRGGYYHNQWDTQMGEESFATPEHMNDEQLAGRRKFVLTGFKDTVKEISKRQDPGSVLALGNGNGKKVYTVEGSAEAAAADEDFALIMDADLAANRYPTAKMEAARQAPHTSLMAEVCTDAIWQRYKSKASSGPAKWTLARAINSGVRYPESFVGCHAGDKESYDDFKDFYYPLIEKYHEGFQITSSQAHVSDMSPWKINSNLTPGALSKIISTRIRVARNLSMFPLNPGGTLESRLEIASLLERVYDRLSYDSNLAGAFLRHSTMSNRQRQSLINDRFLFRGKDRMQAASGYHEHWPEGRGIFHNHARTFINWVNEGDHLRIIAMEPGGDVKACFARLSAGIAAISAAVIAEAKVTEAFMVHPKLGNVTCCPSNLGSGMRGSVHIRVPTLINKIGFDAIDKICRMRQCQARGSTGEHTAVVDRIDVSNWRRIGVPEWQLVEDMIGCVNYLAQLEDSHGECKSANASAIALRSPLLLLLLCCCYVVVETNGCVACLTLQRRRTRSCSKQGSNKRVFNDT